MVVVDRHRDTCSVVYDDLILVLLPSRPFLLPVLELEFTIQLGRAALVFFKP